MTGYISIAISLVITFVLFVFSKNGGLENVDIYRLLAQITGLFGSVLISWNFLLATRFAFLEKIFNGIDKVYKTHNVIGNVAFILILNHPIFLILQNLPINTTALYLIPNPKNLPYLFGIIALYTLIVLIILTIFVDLRYRLWKKTHELIGIVIIFASLHSLLISSDISSYMPLRIWILGWNILAIVAYLYKRYLYYLFTPKNNYLIENVTKDKNYLLIKLKVSENGKAINFRSGQFAFFSLNSDRRNEHPFSILEQEGRTITLGAKMIGDFTTKLANLTNGEYINVYGPFGSFSNNLNVPKNMIWISAGIGITPFLTMIKNIRPDQTVTMIHSARSDESEIFLEKFKQYGKQMENFNFILHSSDVDGRLNEKNISKYTNLDKNTYVYICGPVEMMEYMLENLPEEGVMKKRIIFEDFKLKP